MDLQSAPLRVTIVGSGNVAWGLAPALTATPSIHIVRVISRDPAHASALAAAIGPGVEATTDLSEAAHDADIVILAVSDKAIAPIAASAPPSSTAALWIHTSGSVDAGVLSGASPRYGVLYPMQTFTRGVAVDLSDAPIFIEASDGSTLAIIRHLAESISSNVREADSDGRRRLHCAAVFACNFTNHMWDIADSIARGAGASVADYMPLIQETLRKAATIGPHDGQTGPARRGDKGVMEAHQALLPPLQREIYRLLSTSITSQYEQD